MANGITPLLVKHELQHLKQHGRCNFMDVVTCYFDEDS